MVQSIFIGLLLLAVIAGIGIAASQGRKFRTLQAAGASRAERDSAQAWRFGGIITAVVSFIGALIVFLAATLVINGIGEAKVIANIDGSVDRTVEVPTTTLKAPWQEYVDFDLFSQELVYAGGTSAPSYTGGTVNGQEVTVSVGGLNGGSTQANVDISITYTVDAEEVADIYAKYKTQERFTRQVIEKTILSVIRSVPTKYTAIEFRGAEKDAAAQLILDRVNDRLSEYGVTVDFVNIQAIRYPDSVETALTEVETANQQAAKAEAELRAAEVAAQQRVVEAQAQADANNILNASLTANLLQQRYIEALTKANTIYVVPDGSTPFIGAGPR